MRLQVLIPLCWKGKRVYIPAMDEYRGGWLWLGVRFICERTAWPSGIKLNIQWNVGLKI